METGLVGQKQTALFDDHVERLGSQLSLQSDMIHNIQQKLHSLLDRKGDLDVKQGEIHSPIPLDINGKLDYYIGELNSNNKLLDNILRHLSEIID